MILGYTICKNNVRIGDLFVRRHNPKQIIKACCISFEGKTDREVAKILQVAPVTISNWRKLDIWKQTEQGLIAVEIQKQTENIRKRDKKQKKS